MVANSVPNSQDPIPSKNYSKLLIVLMAVVIVLLIIAISVILVIFKSGFIQTILSGVNNDTVSFVKSTQPVVATTIEATQMPTPSATSGIEAWKIPVTDGKIPVVTPIQSAVDTSGWKLFTVGTTKASLKIPATWFLTEDAAQYASFTSPGLEAPYDTLCRGPYNFSYHIYIGSVFNSNLAANFLQAPDSSKDIYLTVNGKQVKFSYFVNQPITAKYYNNSDYYLTQTSYVYAAIVDGYIIEFSGNYGSVTKTSTTSAAYACEPPEKDWETAINILSTISVK